ncbi:ALG9 [Candida margitis]|uniref:ALG9 n=1 Tax=Candida margitis TaxID=1775924 RepID=UPI002227F7C2|nr:ALG9 [Candida margitis]KAI5969711.1 ALG9 [Candida margitis]
MGLTKTQYGLIFLNVAFRLYSSLYMIIGDCDETFNYWEPLNLLLRQFGKQTWEYSPVYSIRSYAYLIPYYIIGKVIQLFGASPINVFYGLRVVALCGFTSFVELNLFANLHYYSTNLANWWLFLTSINVGMSHGGVALLPSSLASQTTLLANTYIFRSLVVNNEKTRDRSSNLLKAVTWYLIGGFLGWPFALALGLPIGVYTLWQIAQQRISAVILIKIGLVLLCIVSTITLIDSFYLQKLVFVPINIVLYNVFGGDGEGPEIFGVEPLSYYILNLLLNFQFILPLAALGVLLNPFITTNANRFSTIVSAQLIIWCGIFFSQPHKEERFMYPIYPLITLSAAITISKLTAFVKNKLPRIVYYAAQFAFIATSFTISVLRIVNLVENYAAPLHIYQAVSQLPVSLSSTQQVNVCTGKEWYHFPNSFHLPPNYRLKFVESGFDGLLPGDFYEPKETIIESTTFVPSHMNNQNQFESDKVIPLNECDYFVDNSQLGSTPQLMRPDLSIVDDANWRILQCRKIINPDGHHNLLGKLIYIPYPLRRLVPYNVEYMDLCLLQRTKQGEEKV